MGWRDSRFGFALLLLAGVTGQALGYEVLDNGKLRFGTGSQASINTNGNLQQPFYYDSTLNQWYKLTYGVYPLDNAIGIGGDGTNEWNLNGTVAENSSLTGQTLDVSGFTLTSGSKGYGVIVSTGTVTIAGKTLELKNTYTLGADKSFIKIVTRLTNTSGASLGNVRIWVGTRDDWVGTSDTPTKKRGNLVNGAFAQIASATNRSAALQITSGATGVLFYSTSSKANTAINSCCDFRDAYEQNPATSALQATNDGSYALFVRMNDLANGASEEFIWYYAAGAIADLTTVIGDVAQAANVAVTATAGTGGGISPASASVASGSTTSFVVTPNVGYGIDTVQGCGGSLLGSTYTTASITTACTVTASFLPIQYAVTASANSGGSITPASVQVNHGSATSFTVTPAAGQSISTVGGCGGILNGSSYTTGVITGPCAVEASFTPVVPIFEPATPPLREVNSSTLLTDLPSDITPHAADYNGNALAVTLVDPRPRYGPGEHVLTWHTIDSRGVENTFQQVLRIWPAVSLGPDVSLGFQQGNSTSFRIVLNGPAPQAPFSVSYTVSGHMTGHDLESGSVQFGAGEMEKEVFFAVTQTPPVGSSSQDIQVELSDDVNRGERHRLTIHLLAANAAPVVKLIALQGGVIQPVFMRSSDAVTIQTQVSDPNSQDTHTVEWIAPSGASVSNAGDILTLQTGSLPAGLHRFEAIVTDSGSPALSTHGILDIVLAEAQTPLPDGADTWADNGLPVHAEYNPPLRNVLPEREHELARFLIEGDPGLRLALGPHALEAQRLQAELPATAMGPDSVVNVGGYFDFVVSELPAVGQSINIVIPQRAQIPAHPVYRKYDVAGNQWKTFVEDSMNALASAPGGEGICPPPGSSQFRAGLNPGDWCVRLTLSDGGPNDGDGKKNGVVVDPGGVGALATVVVTTSGKGGGGGAIDPLLLLLSGALLLARCMTRSGSRLTLLSVLAAGSTAASGQTQWYGGLQVGPAQGNVSANDVNAQLADAGYDAAATFSDLNRNAWRLYAGYALSSRVSAEAGYTDLGEVRMALQGNVADIDAFLASADRVHPHSARGIDLSLRGRYALTERLFVAGRGGLLRWNSRYRATNQAGETARLTTRGTGVLLGAGMEFALSSAWSVGVDWTSHRIDGESIGFTALGITYRLN